MLTAPNHSLAKYFAGDYTKALDCFREFTKSPPAGFSEHNRSEMFLFEARILDESGHKEDAIKFLEGLKTCANQLSKEEMTARLALECDQFEKAEQLFATLIRDRNPENYNFHRGFQVSCSNASHAGYFSHS